jgi:cytochrome c
MKKSVLVSLVLTGMLTIVSCKKENEESFGKQEATIEATTETPTEATTPTSSEAQSSEELGATIFAGKGTCATCHKPDTKLIGPSLQEIAKIYKEKNADMVTFLKGEGKPIVDPSQFEVMKANFALTKTFSDEELKALETYIYSHLK